MNQDPWVDALFQSERTRGLSGPIRPVLGLYEDEAFFSSRVWRHVTHSDVVEDPSQLWKHEGSGGGIFEHLQDPLSPPGGHVLILLARDDHDRASTIPGWFDRAAKTLTDSDSEIHAGGVRWARDGDTSAGIPDFQLEAGCFASGCLPNVHAAKAPETSPRWGVYVQVVGQDTAFHRRIDLWEGQRMLTLGNHWLDNLQIPALPTSATYRLFRNPEGQFVHLLAPELEDQLQLSSERRGDQEILTLARRDGQSLVHFMIVDPTTSETVSPLAYERRWLTLVERGVLLQKVHFSRFMVGYDVYVDQSAQISTTRHDPVITVQVRRKSVSLVAHIEGISLNEQALEIDQPVVLDADAVIDMVGRSLQFRSFQHLRGTDGWPYVGEIRRRPLPFHLAWNETHRIGRALGSRIALPDDGVNQNIHWRAEVSEATTIMMRTGDVPKANFYTDSIMVASEHARLVFDEGSPSIECVARHCFTFVRRHDQVIPLVPTTSSTGTHSAALEPGDEVLVGNSLFEVSYAQTEAPVAPTPAPEVELTEHEPQAQRVPVPAPREAAMPRPSPVVSLTDAPPAPVKKPEGVGSTMGEVVSVDEQQAMFELGRSTQLVMLGWMITGEMTCGNHQSAAMIVSENQTEPDQHFNPLDYFRLRVRGRRRRVTVLSPSELLVGGAPPDRDILEDLGEQAIEVIRRDAGGEPDFMVRMHVVKDRRLPDPRGLMCQIDHDEPLAASLFTLGIPEGTPRTVSIGALSASVKAIDQGVEIDAYLDTYQIESGYHPFFIQTGEQRFHSAPEDGRKITLAPGDRLLLGNALYQVVRR